MPRGPGGRELFADTRRRLRGLLDADEAPPHPIFDALADTARRYDIPVGYFEEILEGVEMDMTRSRFRSFDELRTYCYKVASVVGLVCIEIFEYDDARARDYAIALGIGMQLTNIIRDVREDAEMGRIYIPADEIAAHGYSEEELVRGVANEPFLRLMRFQAERGAGAPARGAAACCRSSRGAPGPARRCYTTSTRPCSTGSRRGASGCSTGASGSARARSSLSWGGHGRGACCPSPPALRSRPRRRARRPRGLARARGQRAPRHPRREAPLPRRAGLLVSTTSSRAGRSTTVSISSWAAVPPTSTS